MSEKANFPMTQVNKVVFIPQEDSIPISFCVTEFESRVDCINGSTVVPNNAFRLQRWSPLQRKSVAAAVRLAHPYKQDDLTGKSSDSPEGARRSFASEMFWEGLETCSEPALSHPVPIQVNLGHCSQRNRLEFLGCSAGG